MIETDVTVKNRAGLHTRPAAAVVKIASRYKCEFFVERDGIEINGKSIIGVMTLSAECGTILRLRFEGEDEQEACNEMVQLFEDGFGEL